MSRILCPVCKETGLHKGTPCPLCGGHGVLKAKPEVCCTNGCDRCAQTGWVAPDGVEVRFQETRVIRAAWFKERLQRPWEADAGGGFLVGLLLMISDREGAEPGRSLRALLSLDDDDLIVVTPLDIMAVPRGRMPFRLYSFA